MAKKAIVIHGTEGYPEENWFPWLKSKLEERGYEVTIPQFPTPPLVPAKISEWFDVIDQYDFTFDEDCLVVGHSLGGIFALRLLESTNSRVKAVFLSGTPVGVRPILNYDRDEAFSGFDFDWDRIRNSAVNFQVFQSDNDPYVDLANGYELAKKLDVELNFIPNAGHFNKKSGYTEFYELLEKIDRLEK